MTRTIYLLVIVIAIACSFYVAYYTPLGKGVSSIVAFLDGIIILLIVALNLKFTAAFFFAAGFVPALCAIGVAGAIFGVIKDKVSRIEAGPVFSLFFVIAFCSLIGFGGAIQFHEASEVYASDSSPHL